MNVGLSTPSALAIATFAQNGNSQLSEYLFRKPFSQFLIPRWALMISLLVDREHQTPGISFENKTAGAPMTPFSPLSTS
ncbi:hypothetical protein ABKN59_006635 [Abortiporus biennis]